MRTTATTEFAPSSGLDDAELISLAPDFEHASLAWDRAVRARNAAEQAGAGRKELQTLDNVVAAASDRANEYVERIVTLPAHTLDGIRVKVMAAIWAADDPTSVPINGDLTERAMANVSIELVPLLGLDEYAAAIKSVRSSATQRKAA